MKGGHGGSTRRRVKDPKCVGMESYCPPSYLDWRNMLEILKDNEAASKITASIFLEYDADSDEVSVCAQDADGSQWYLCAISRNGIYLHSDIGPDLGLKTDGTETLVVTREAYESDSAVNSGGDSGCEDGE